MDSEKIYYVYVYLDPRYPIKKKWLGYRFNYIPFYIGKGKGNRYLSHIQDFYKLDFKSMTSKEKHDLERKFHKINSIKNKFGSDPIIEMVAENLDEISAFKLEGELIEAIGRVDFGGTLSNYRGGGCGGGSLSPESKEKVSLKLKKYYKENDIWNKDVPMTEEAKEHLRKVNTGKKQTKETIKKRVKTIKALYKEKGDEINKKRKDTLKKIGYVRDNKAIGKKISATKKGNVVISEKQKTQNSTTLKNKPLQICPHCGKESRSVSFHYMHFDNCMKNPNINKSALIKCPHCGCVSNNKGSMNRWHFDNCKYKK